MPMSTTTRPWYVGAQNDGLFLIAGKPPAKDNDYPVHDANRTVIAKFYESMTVYHDADLVVQAVNLFDEARAALEVCRDYISGWDGVAPCNPPTDKRSREAQEALELARAVLAKMTPPKEQP